MSATRFETYAKCPRRYLFERVLRVSSALDFGKVWVNCHLVVAAEMPNNGYKHSGHGNDLSVFAIEEYTRLKHVMSRVGPAE